MDTEFNTNEFTKILQEHNLWINSGGEKGTQADLRGANLKGINIANGNLKKALLRSANFENAYLEKINLEEAELLGANFRGANLQGVNFQWANCEDSTFERANLQNANFQGAYLGYGNLREANLREANLEGAYLRSANLEGANLGAANLKRASFELANLERANLREANHEGANFRDAHFGASLGTAIALGIINSADIFQLTQSIHQYELVIDELNKQLQNTQYNGRQVEEIKQKLEETLTSKQQTEVQLKQLQEQNEKLKGELNNRIGDAKKSLENSLKNTTDQINKNVELAEEFGKIAKVILALVALGIFLIPLYAIWRLEQFPKESWHMVFYTFPVIAMILIATTLLRHQKALLNEVRYFSMMKHQIELYSGLLEASQHTAASMGDPQKANEYVQETFTQIRNRLLSEQIRQDHYQMSEGKEEDLGSDKIINLLDKITNLANKRPS
ncbi:Type III effector pipB2 [Neisseria animaloris]|uniref:pentapeptide repeat-containing protein n=1 Tax=Neisseria animaloris TaxID=326522 RepID=UPI000A19AE1F|nr:pentapeptide repeat-containing protein [Neisseria animaloris]OSI07936.1 hypothetical protein BWD08_04820 [Neisseria animaloris]VEH87630.1 Type III effector pipB2 [Neisseria animaloris]